MEDEPPKPVPLAQGSDLPPLPLAFLAFDFLPLDATSSPSRSTTARMSAHNASILGGGSVGPASCPSSSLSLSISIATAAALFFDAEEEEEPDNSEDACSSSTSASDASDSMTTSMDVPGSFESYSGPPVLDRKPRRPLPAEAALKSAYNCTRHSKSVQRSA